MLPPAAGAGIASGASRTLFAEGEGNSRLAIPILWTDIQNMRFASVGRTPAPTE
jgi:hypothetical protein